MFFSLAMTAVWTALGRTLQASELVRTTLNPEAVAADQQRLPEIRASPTPSTC
ncbi:MAG: hypothetical protein M0C28_05335 [Candidatus Moduliflexus flocculans]|nr:hypothetical protein [Candidatus Moduliflexus flocculans]